MILIRERCYGCRGEGCIHCGFKGVVKPDYSKGYPTSPPVSRRTRVARSHTSGGGNGNG